MAVTVALPDGGYFIDGGHGMKVRASIAFDNSYLTGGEVVSAGQFGLAVIEAVTIDQTSGFVIGWDQANLKFKFFSTASISVSNLTSATSLAKHLAGAIDETSSADDISALTGVQVWVYGI